MATTTHPDVSEGANVATEVDVPETTRASSDPGPQHLDTSANGLRNAKSSRSSLSHWDPEPGFAHIDGDVGGSGLNETAVDIVAIPCIGASPVETWNREPLPSDGYFGLPPPTELAKYPTVKHLPGQTILSPGIDRHLPKAQHLWIRHGIRKEVNIARVLLYRHRELYEGLTLDEMAEDLLHHICEMRKGQTKSRPLFFICHSIGGLVAKLALIKASKREELRWIIFDCHGMTFFGMVSKHLESTQLTDHFSHTSLWL